VDMRTLAQSLWLHRGLYDTSIRADYWKNLTEVVFQGVPPLLSPRRAIATWKLVRLSTESVVCRTMVF
jgi:hypothetical protein